MRAWIEAPPLDVLVDDGPLDAAALDRVLSVTVRQMVLAPAQCEVVFRDPPDALAARLAGTPGRHLRVLVHGGTELFAGEIAAVELVHSPSQQRELRARAYDALHRLRRRHPVRLHTGTTLNALAALLAGDCALSLDSEVDGGSWELLPQWHSSDLELLVEAAARSGAWFTASGGVLHLFPLSGRTRELELVLGDTLLEARIEHATVEPHTGFRALTWDAATGRVSEELHGDAATSGRTYVNLAPAEQAAALVGAAAAHEHAVAGVLWAIAEGDQALEPGVKVRVPGTGPLFEREYVLTDVVHTIDAKRGYLTELSSRPPPWRPARDAAAVAPGIVTSVDDPDGLGRIQASLPTYPSLASGWMRVVLPAAGPDKGLVALPDVGDEVLILLPGGDPAQGIVLGGLYGDHPPPDAGTAGGAVERYRWQTRGSQSLAFDDAAGRVALANRAGTTLVLDDQQALLRSATDLEIAAPGRRITITAAAVDFRKG